MHDSPRTIRITKLSEQGQETDLRNTTPEERVEMMWQLAIDAWAFKGQPVSNEPFQRHIVRVIRGKEE
jgi:hypothetical protein